MILVFCLVVIFIVLGFFLLFVRNVSWLVFILVKVVNKVVLGSYGVIFDVLLNFKEIIEFVNVVDSM